MWCSPPPMRSRTPRCGAGPLHGPSGTPWAGGCARRCRGRRWGTGRPGPADPTRCSRSWPRTRAGSDGWCRCGWAGWSASPYGFLRGTAVVMAEDLGHLPATGITPVICGDSHLGNFGFYASPERDLVIDLNDFDEAHPGGWEWDLRRLAASIWVAGRQNGHRGAVRTAVRVLRGDVPRAGALARGPAAAGPLVRARGPGPAPRQRLRAVTARGDPARRASRPGRTSATGRCPGSPSSTTAGAGSSPSPR